MNLIVTFSDGSRWSMPLKTVIERKVHFYNHEFKGILEKEYTENPLPLIAWFRRTYNWSDIARLMTQITPAAEPAADYAQEWPNAAVSVEE